VRYGEGVDALLRYVEDEHDVLECYAVTGDYDYLIKICAESIEALEEKLLYLKKQKGIVKSHTMFSLQEHKFSATVLPNNT
jgi:DNA-binding Lrp family transcriptional regulator